MIERKVLVDVLKRVEPALSSRDLIPVFACFCFDGSTVTAYDDVVALRVPLDIGVRGAVRGRVLLDFLNGSKAKEIEVEQSKTDLTVKAGRSKLQTGVLPADNFLFAPPDTKKANRVKVTKTFLDALARVSASMGRDPSHTWRLGVTLTHCEKGVTLYASDDKSASRCVVSDCNVPEGFVTVLPPRFCELLAAVGRSDPAKEMVLAGEWVTARFASGLELFSRSIVGADVKLFRGLFGPLTKTAADGGTIAVPKGLRACLDRALVVIPFAKTPFTSLDVADGRLRLETASDAGNVRDAVTLEGDHPKASIRVTPELLLKLLPNAERFRVLPAQGVLLKGPGYLGVVANVHLDRADAGGHGDDEGDEQGEAE